MRRRMLVLALALLVPHANLRAQDAPVPLQEAAARMSLPEGFRVTLFAGEPDVVQPIAFTFDDRGRLWVVECLSYPDWETEGRDGHDRVVIFEDADGDGVHDKRTVFWDQGTNLTGIEYGFGGIWLCATPNLIFVPDRNGDDVPDGEPEVLLDGWDLKAKHNVFNGLTWGPDGWLYGCNGILSNSLIGKPGTPENERVAMNCGVWRYHPTRRTFEAVAHGTTNPWGLDFDQYGEMFITNCVIKHLFHVAPGGHYVRMFGQDINPYSYGLIESCADHIHWGGGHWTESRGGQGEHDKAGGGHAHAGAMIYLGDNWPAKYRGRIFMCNIHGSRVNQDSLERSGSGYVAGHEPDFLFANDPWFRGLQLKYGPDGGVYLTDWSDTGECHDYEDIHRENGRIYKITYGKTKSEPIDLAKLSDADLVNVHFHSNEWHVRHARRILQERHGEKVGEVRGEIYGRAHDPTNPTRAPMNPVQQLRLLWTVHALSPLHGLELTVHLQSPDETVRAAVVRMATDVRAIQVSSAVIEPYVEMAKSDPSPAVRLALASALQRIPHEQRWPIAGALVARAEDADDPNLPLMYWYGIEPLVAVDEDSSGAIELLKQTRIPLLRRFIARRLAEGMTEPGSLAPLVTFLRQPEIGSRRRGTVERDVLLGIYDVARGLRDVPMPEGWPEVAASLRRKQDVETRELATALSLIFGDEQVMEQLRGVIADASVPEDERGRAIAALVEARDPSLPAVLQALVREGVLRRPALRGLASYRDEQTPEVILAHYGELDEAERTDAIATLSSRPEYALALLEAVERGAVPRTDLSTFAARQLASLGDERINARLAKVWGEVRPTSEQKAQIIADYKAMLTEENLKDADPAAGRVVFSKTCATCHQLFDAGRGVGPNLTGSQRANVDYVLENLVDPNALIGRDYQLTVIVTTEGRILTGIVTAENENSVTLRTANEDVILPKTEIEERRQSNVSMMPEGMLDKLSDAEVVNLVRYLASPEQVPLSE